MALSALLKLMTFRGGWIKSSKNDGELFGEASHEEVAVQGVMHVVSSPGTPALNVPGNV